MTCIYHPMRAASNRCDPCDSKYCNECSDESASLRYSRLRSGHSSHACFVCSSPLDPLVGSDAVPPFWKDFGKIYSYPLNFEAISAIVVVAFATAFFRNLGLLILLPTLTFILYSFACLRETAQGNLEAPNLDTCFEGSIAPVFYAIIIFAIAVIGAGLAFTGYGTGVGILVSLFMIIVAPAAIILIAIEEQFFAAMNVSKLVEVIRSTGTSYFVMLLFIFIMSSSLAIMQSYFGTSQLSFFGVVLQSVVSNYYNIVIFHIMGYVVYQNQATLGFRLNSSASSGAERTDEQRLKAQIDVLIKAGEYDAAREVATQQLSQGNATLWDWSRTFSLMCVGKRSNRVQIMFDDYTDKLQALGDTQKISDAYTLLIKHQPTFAIKEHPRRLMVANSLYENGEYVQVVKLLQSFHKESKDHTLVAQALKLMGESYAFIPGREKHAEQFKTLHQLSIRKP